MLLLRVLLITCAVTRPALSRPTYPLMDEVKVHGQSSLAQKMAQSSEFKLDTAPPSGAALPVVQSQIEDKGVQLADRSEPGLAVSCPTAEISEQKYSTQEGHSVPQPSTDLDFAPMGDALEQTSAQIPDIQSPTLKDLGTSSTSDSPEQKPPHTESSTTKGLDSSSINDTPEKSVQAPRPARFSKIAEMYRKRTWGHYVSSHRYGTSASLAAGYLAHSKYSDESMGFEMDFMTALCCVGAYFLTNSLFSEWCKLIKK